MKKVLIILAAFFGLILLAAVLVPILFKDDIRAALDKEIANNVDATLYYNPDAFSLSLFKSFPDLSVTIDEFGVAGVGVFEGDTLADIKSFNLTLDIMSVISGDQIRIVNVKLDRPTINVLVLEDGRANYDIAKSSGEEAPTDTTASAPISIQISRWEIIEGNVVYADATIPTVVYIGGLNHTGSGDFAQDVFDMVTTTQVASFSLGYDGVEYITEKTLKADLTMEMDLANMKFTFKENTVSLNDFGFGFDGFVSMPADDIDMDITYTGKGINLQSVLSLIPGVYTEYLEGVDASGTVSFDGFVRGSVTETDLPAVVANFGISNGRVAYSEFPLPLEDIQVKATFEMPTADLTQTSFTMDKFHMTLDGEETTAYLYFKDLEDYYWDFRLNGNLDLAKLTKVVPIADTELRGKINAKLETKGRMSDLDAERYVQLPTSGSMSITDLYYASPDLPQGFGIAKSRMTFNPQTITLASFKGNAGKSDLNLSGSLTNYLAYALNEEATLYGQLDYYSALLDVNEWMVPSETDVEETDTAALEVVRIPENIDFVLASRIDKILYDNLELSNFKGQVVVREGSVRMEKTGFNMLDGYFEMDGAYESAASLEDPLFNFDFTIKELSIPQAFKAFITIQKLVPVAEKMTGKFSTDFALGGAVGSDMMPLYDQLHGAGLVEVLSASVENLKVLNSISDVSKLSAGGEKVVTVKDVIMSTEIKNGRLYVDPFNLNFGGKQAVVSGSTGLDGSLDYVMNMEVPSGQVGQALNSAISSFAGMNNVVDKDITLRLGIGGNYEDPKVKLLGAETSTGGSTVKTAVKAKAQAEMDAKKEQISQEVQQKKDSVEAVAQEKVEEVKEQAAEEVQKATEEATDKAKDALKGLLKKKGGG